MNVTTRAQGFDLTAAIDRFTRSSLESALARVGSDVIAIDVFLKDTNGPKGGVDKLALIRVQLRDRQSIAISTTHDDLYAAIKMGTQRTKRAIRRHVRRSRRVDRQRMHPLWNGSTVKA